MPREALLDAPPAGESLMRALREAALKFNLVAGAGANTNIAVAGIATTDTLVFVLEIPASAAATDRTSIASVTSAGNIQLTATSAGNQLLVVWAKKNA